MGPGPRFEINFNLRSFMFGVSCGNFRYDYDIDICVGFITISIGLGKSYLERES